METVNKTYPDAGKGNIGFEEIIFAVKPGDGSAREQAASCQKVLWWQILPTNMLLNVAAPINLIVDVAVYY